MTRSIFAMEIADLSAFAKSLRKQIDALANKPSHAEMLNLLARAAGYRNYQHFRSAAQSAKVLNDWNLKLDPEPLPDEVRVLKALRHFDERGRLIRWPGRRGLQELCLWFLWSKIPATTELTEREIGDVLNRLHLFSDAALLRRELFDFGLVHRTRDGRQYRRLEKKPPAELGLLLRRMEIAAETA
ncbi:hypothetical protein FHX15_003693 [Rhizobium sp. BK650]|uniref:DUF2087 domain-containing protein n=1 Tax=Rhizobium sp. BK650 TaxID=2586990 RepID=UPI00160B3B00|nr:DUF2087 domain-containing protein [Rhizobium sp. BK650]MBB3658446.1 hypothetical protein [Rhizobium sp. BK650]